jgi:hypothetical protein
MVPSPGADSIVTIDLFVFVIVIPYDPLLMFYVSTSTLFSPTHCYHGGLCGVYCMDHYYMNAPMTRGRSSEHFYLPGGRPVDSLGRSRGDRVDYDPLDACISDVVRRFF